MYIDPVRVPLTLVRGWCLAAAVACEVVWVVGSGPWLVGPPPAGVWGHSGLLSWLVVLGVVGLVPVHALELW